MILDRYTPVFNKPDDDGASPEYPPMDEKRRIFLDYVIKMYDGQENDPRFKNSDRITVDLPGLKNFIIKKYVYSPEHVNVALAWPEHIARKTKDKAFLDMGTGTGIAAVYVALNGSPRRVVATDISPLAAENCRENAAQFNLKEPLFSVREGDVYSGIDSNEKFDIMFWNFPWNAPDQDIEAILRERNRPVTQEKIMQLKAGLDTQYKALRRFIADGKKYLNPGGELLLGAGEMVRHDIIYGEAERNGYDIEIAEEKEMVIDTIGNAKTKVILYRLKPKENL